MNTRPHKPGLRSNHTATGVTDEHSEPVTDEILKRFRGHWKVAGRSLVDELIQERREEARREQKELEDTNYPSKADAREQ